MMTLKIADMIIDIHISEEIKNTLNKCDEKEVFHKSFFDFAYKGKKYVRDILWNVEFLNENIVIKEKSIYSSEALNIYIHNDEFIYLYNEENIIPKKICCSDKFKKCVFFIPNTYKEMMKEKEVIEEVQICLYNMFREMFFYACILENRIPIHSASIIYQDRAYLFSAPSGVGKSTHTNLWHDIYNVDILDGDVAMCRVIENNGIKKAVAYGMPWCGTSEIYMNKKVEFAGIVFLMRGTTNEIFTIDRQNKAIKLLINSFTVMLTEELVDCSIKTIEELSECIDGYILKCLPDNEAVEKVKNAIEKKVKG